MSRALSMVIVMLAAAPVATVGSCRVLFDDIPCSDLGACPTDLTCVDGVCLVPGGGRDGDDGNEGEGEGGVEGEGESGVEGEGEGTAVTCVDDGDCAGADFACVRGDCRLRCDDDGGCDVGEFCVAGICGAGCDGDGDCPVGDFCAFAGIFDPDTACVPGCRLNGVGCSGDDVCHLDRRVCQEPTPGTGAVADRCVNDSECQAPFVCILFQGDPLGFCTERCTEDPDVIGPTDCGSFGCCFESGLDKCSLGFCFEGCDSTACDGAANCCPSTGLPLCFIDLCSEGDPARGANP